MGTTKEVGVELEPIEAPDEPILTLDETVRYLGVRKANFSAWKKQYQLQRVWHPDGRKKTGYALSTLQAFVRSHPEFSHTKELTANLTETEVQAIRNEAGVLFADGKKLPQVSSTLARATNTSRSMIGRLVRDLAPDGAMSERQGEKLDREETMASWDLDYMGSEDFTKRSAENTICAELPHNPKERRTRAPSGLPAYLASLYEVPLLNREQEEHIFRRMNYAKFRASEIVSEDPTSITITSFREASAWVQMAEEDFNEIVRRNLRLPVSICKKFASGEELFEMVSDANDSLMKAARKFDYTRGNKFATYATWAIQKNACRTYADSCKQKDRFRNDEAAIDQLTQYDDVSEGEQVQRQGEYERVVERAISMLPDPREQVIIQRRFGVGDATEKETLKVVGEELGVTKERIRQIEARAMAHFRAAVVEIVQQNGVSDNLRSLVMGV